MPSCGPASTRLCEGTNRFGKGTATSGQVAQDGSETLVACMTIPRPSRAFG